MRGGGTWILLLRRNRRGNSSGWGGLNGSGVRMGTGMVQVERIGEKSIGRELSFGITHCNHIHHLQNYLEVEEKI